MQVGKTAMNADFSRRCRKEWNALRDRDLHPCLPRGAVMAGKALQFSSLEDVLQEAKAFRDAADGACSVLEYELALDEATTAVELLSPIEGYHELKDACRHIAGFALESLGRAEEAEAMYRANYEDCLQGLGPCEETVDSLMAVVNLVGSAMHDFQSGQELVQEFLGRYLEQLDVCLEGRLQHELAYLQSEMGLHEEADATLEKSISILENGDENCTRQLVQALNLQAAIHQERGRIHDALEVAQKGHEVAESLGEEEEEATERIGSVLVSFGAYALALPLFESLVVDFEHIEEEVGEMTRKCLFSLTTIYVAFGRLNEAQECVEKVMATRKAFESHPLDVLYALVDYGSFLRGAYFLEEAYAVACESLELSARALPEDHEFHGIAALDLGEAEFNLSRLGEAKVLFKRALRLVIVANGEEHQDTSHAKYCLGALYLACGRPSKALPLCTAGADILEQISSPANPEVHEQRATVVAALVDEGKFMEAGPIVTALADLQQEDLPGICRARAAVLRARAKVCLASGQHSEGVSHALAANAILADIYNHFDEYRGSVDVAESQLLLAEGAFLSGSHNDALDHARAAAEMITRVQSHTTSDKEHYLAGQVRWMRGKVLLAQHKAAEAVEELRAAEALYVEQFGEKHPHWHLDAVRVALGRALEESEKCPI